MRREGEGKQVVIDVPFNPQKHISNSYTLPVKKEEKTSLRYLNSDKKRENLPNVSMDDSVVHGDSMASSDYRRV